MAAAMTARPTGRSSWTVAPGSNERAFRKARRHSRVVRVLRFALPALIVAATAGISVSTYLNRLLAPLPAKIDTLVVSGSKITMDRPHMTGFTRDERAYEVRAAAAIQDVTKPNVIELKSIDAKVQMQDKSTVRLKAPRWPLRQQEGNVEARPQHPDHLDQRLSRPAEGGRMSIFARDTSNRIIRSR